MTQSVPFPEVQATPPPIVRQRKPSRVKEFWTAHKLAIVLGSLVVILLVWNFSLSERVSMLEIRAKETEFSFLATHGRTPYQVYWDWKWDGEFNYDDLSTNDEIDPTFERWRE